MPEQPEKSYVGGETHYYLGRQYRLKIVESNTDDVVLRRGIICVYTKNRRHSSRVKTLLEKWYREKARVKFEERLSLCLEKAKRHGFERPDIQIRNMKTRWGSCTRKGAIILNTHLIKAPSHCNDYVIMHEMCHLKYFDHGKQFYNLLVKVIPDWQKRKKRLEEVVV